MKEYMPKYVGTVTKYVFVESPDMTPADLAIRPMRSPRVS